MFKSRWEQKDEQMTEMKRTKCTRAHKQYTNGELIT